MDKKKKVIEFEIRGNTLNLDTEISKAVANINDLQRKMQSMATKGTARSGTLSRATGLSSSVNYLDNIQKQLLRIDPQNVTADKLNLIAAATEGLTKENARLTGRTAGTSKEIDAMRKRLKKLDKSLKLVTKSTGGFSKKLGSAMLQMFALQRAITWLVGKLKEGVLSSMDFVETINLFNVSAGKSAKTLGEWSNQFARIFGMDPNEVLKYVGTFNLLAQSLGANQQESELLGKNLVKISYDLASLFNTDIETMAVAIRAGITGISKPLKKYGIVINDTLIKQEAAMMGITKSWSEMSEIDKMGLRYITILKQASKAQGDLAKTLESPQNQFKVFTAQLDMFFRNIGNIIMIAGKLIMPLVNGLLIGINTLLEAFSRGAGYEIPNFSNNLQDNTGAIEEEEDAVDSLNKSMKKALMPFDELNVLADDANKDHKIYEMDPKIAEALKGYDNLMDKVKTKMSSIGDAIERALNPGLLKSFGSIGRLAFDILGIGIDVVIGLLNALSYPLGLITKALEYLLKPITAIIDGWHSADKATRGWAIAGGVALGMILALIVAQKALNHVRDLGNGSLKEGIKFLGQWIKFNAQAIASTIKSIAVKIKDVIITKAQTIANWWHNASLAAKITLVSGGALAGVAVAAGIAAAVMSSKANETQNSLPQPEAALATGGVVNRATLAMVGEGKYSEAVVPLGNSPQFSQMKQDIADAVSSRIGNGGKDTQSRIVVEVKIGERDFKSYTYKVVNEENRRNTGISLERLSTQTSRR